MRLIAPSQSMSPVIRRHSLAVARHRRSSPGSSSPRDQSSFLSQVPQPLLELLSSAMETTHDRSNGNIHDLGDFLVRKSLDIRKENRHPELLREVFEGRLDDLVGDALEHLRLGAADGLDRFAAAE